MPSELLAGCEPVLAALKARLEAGLPAERQLFEDAQGPPTPPPDDPDEADIWRLPGLYATEGRYNLQPDDYPAILVVPQRSLPTRIVDFHEGRATRIVPWVVRTWVLCRHWGYPEVQAVRNRLAVVVEQTYLRRLHLNATMAIVAGGWTSSYSDVDVDDDDSRSYAGWWLEMIVESTEHLGDPQLAPAVPGDPLDVSLVVHPAAD